MAVVTLYGMSLYVVGVCWCDMTDRIIYDILLQRPVTAISIYIYTVYTYVHISLVTIQKRWSFTSSENGISQSIKIFL